MTTSKEDVIANLRAIIISSKGGLKLSAVGEDYRETFGEDVPLKAVGCGTLEEFFKNNSQNFSVIGNRVQAIKKASSLHIDSLVGKQKTSSKRGRSKLTSKQDRRMRQPLSSSYEPSAAADAKKLNWRLPTKIKQNKNKDGLSSSLKQVQLQQVAASKKIMAEEGNPEKAKKEDRSPKNQNNVKNLVELKGITRTVKNNQLSSAKEPVLSKIPSQEVNLFDNFEDLHVSSAQSRLLKLKSSLSKKIQENNFDFLAGNNVTHPTASASPFRRSLANNSQQEILSAKKSASVRSSNALIGRISPEMTAELNGEVKYENKLKQFCIEKGLIMPSYSIIVREPVNQPKAYGCKLTIGDSFQVSTYPLETHSEITARELASKKAYHQLSLNNNLPSLFFETEYVVKLRELCTRKKLPEPIFKSMECHPKNEPRYFICKVRIGEDILLSSYPVEAQDELSARDLAAKKAFDHLNSNSKSPAAISKDKRATLSQIFNMIKTKEYGVWSNKVPMLYIETYNEELQPNWFDLVKNSPEFEISSIETVGYIIRAKNKIFEEIQGPGTLASLILPESNQWEVYITNVVNSAEVWCRLIGKDYSGVYDTMMTQLELEPPTMNVKHPEVGEIYLVNLEESWNRVRLIEFSVEKDEASVFLIDIGIEEVVKLSQLFQLQRTFFSVAPQAILLSLNELDCLAECEELQFALFHSLLGNTFIAEVVAILDESGHFSSVNLWDTSTDEDININLKLLDDVIRTIKSPLLPKVGLVKEMFVSYVDNNGVVYVQSSKQNAHYIDWIISTKMKNSASLVPVITKKVDPSKLYVARCNKSGLFYRAKLSKTVDANTVIVKFIDYGYEQQAAIDDLFDLEETSLGLATIPAQVIRVKIADLKTVNNQCLAKIREHILEQSVLVKVTHMPAVSPPLVEFFKRSQADGTLSSITSKITSDTHHQSSDTPTRKKSFVVGLENTVSTQLPMPNIPPKGSYFNVFVTLAAHPGLFNVQPLTTQNELMELMFRLQEKCQATFSKPLIPEEFKIGELYAVKHADDFWYRAYAHAVVSSSAYTVYLCDFGDFIMVPADKLMPLSSEFKTFPYQAIRAYLAGIAPVSKDWSALDCVNFRELVIEKQFVSQVVEINKDAKNPSYISLGLVLVDTSTQEDVYIHQLLVDRKMAVLKN